MDKKYFHSGFITVRNRKVGMVWSGQNAEHVMSERLSKPSLHPFTHIRIQQLAAKVIEWKKQSGARHSAVIKDHKTGITVTIITDIFTNFALPITAFLKSKQ